MTRLADAVAHGHVAHAAATDPAGVVFLVIVGAVAAAYLARRWSPWRPPVPSLRWVPAGLVVTLALHWVTTLTTGGFVAS